MKPLFKGQEDLWLMSLIPFSLLFLFKYVPLAGLVMVFQDFDIFRGFSESPWVGFNNFRDVFSDPAFFRVLKNTLIISFYKLVFFFPIPILLAVMISEVSREGFKKTVQTLVYLPHFISWIVVSGFMFDLLSANGAINIVIRALGGKTVPFMMKPDLFRSLVVISAIWKESGWAAIVFIAGIAGIDQQLYEAASIDGAGRIRKIISVTLPGILPTIVVILLIRIGNILLYGTEQILSIYNPTVYSTGDIIGTYVYRSGLGQQRYSYSATIGFFNSAVGFLMLTLSNWASRKVNERSLW